MNNDFQVTKFLWPKYWPTWIGITLIWLLSRFPFRWQLKLGGILGLTLYYVIASRRKICQINLQLAFPELTHPQIKLLSKSVYQNIGFTVAEMASLWFNHINDYKQKFDVTGLEHIENAKLAGRGVILLQAHFGTLEFCGAWLATQISVCAVYDNPKNALYAALLKNRRERYIDQAIDNRDMRSMVKKLRAGEIVWYSPDQSVKKRDGAVYSHFFNQAVLTTPGTSRITRMTGAVVLPYLAVRSKRTGKYQLTIFPKLENFPTTDQLADTETINQIFESHIRQHPEQYFWVHKRFKRPDKNFPDPYSG